jgi:hypothetical protein|tara:strand:- start:410 stop:733 length:324 start_codon:yes stop_codon:yes gene_type:complete
MDQGGGQGVPPTGSWGHGELDDGKGQDSPRRERDRRGVEISEDGIAQTSEKTDWRALTEWKYIKSAKLTGPKTVTVLAADGPSGWGYVWKVKTGSAKELALFINKHV